MKTHSYHTLQKNNMETFKFSLRNIKLPLDAKDIVISHLLNGSKNRTDTYINYTSQSNPHKNCIYVLENKWEILNGSRTNTFKKDKNNIIITLIELM